MFNREKLLWLLSQLPEDEADAVIRGEIPIEKVMHLAQATEDNLIASDIVRIQVAPGKYVEQERTEIVENQGRLGRVKTVNLYDCGHPLDRPVGGICSFGHYVCSECILWCEVGNHSCCVLDSKIKRNGEVVCYCHRGLNRWSNAMFEAHRVR